MNIAHIEEHSFIYGPGCRFVIWSQGCSIRCNGCWNKEMWNFEIKNEISANELFELIVKEKKLIEGVTILGGEPFDQYEELLILVKLIRETELNIIIYTGYTQNELVDKKNTEIFNYLDILISEKYDKSLRITNGGLIGSSNQRITFLTDKYSQNDLPTTNEIEVSIDSMGTVTTFGYPD
jgi:anaerobic ribonucleoside-triphosphate reductase activating protein